MSQSYSQLANPPNLMSLYLQLDARNRASDQITRGLGLMAASFTRNPQMQRMIMEDANAPSGVNAGDTLNNLMSLYQGQQQMQARQQELASSAEIATKLGVPESYVRAEILAGRGQDLLHGMEMPDTARTYNWFKNQYAQEHQNDTGPDGKPLGADGAGKAFEAQYPPGLAMGGIGGMNDPTTRSMTLARVAWENNPANRGKQEPDYFSDPDKWRVHTQNLTEAQGQFPGLNAKLGSYINDLGDIAADKNLGSVVGGGIAAQIGKGIYKAVPGSDTYALGNKINGMMGRSKEFGQAKAPGQIDLSGISVNPDDFQKTGLSEDDYQTDVIAPRIRAALTGQANMFGASGQLDKMPGYLRPYLDAAYQAGGVLDMGVPFKTVQPDTTKKQITAAEMPQFQKTLEIFGPKRAIDYWRGKGYDVSSLE
jgi:hypothetical protein